MRKPIFGAKNAVLAPLLCLVLLLSCSTERRVESITQERISITNVYDKPLSEEVSRFMRPFQHTVDSLMCPVVGTAATDMWAKQPEGRLSNLLPDILMWASARFQEKPDFAVYNMGGIRAGFLKGDITVGDVLQVAPFENKICFLTLTGSDVLLLFDEMAKNGGECLSHGVSITISRSGRLLGATLDGKAIDESRHYRIATLDYVAAGNDNMAAFKRGTQKVSPKDKGNNVRFLIMDYFKEQAQKHKAVSAEIEGRVVYGE